MPNLIRDFVLLVLLCTSSSAFARLEVCNHTDLVMMISVGYDTTEERTVTEGWWRIYPGFCEVPVDVTFLNGFYYLHAESNPSSTMPDDAFSWGEDKPLCVALSPEFRLPNANFCENDKTIINFDIVKKNWRNYNKVDLERSDRQYKNLFKAKVAGVQRMLSLLGHDIGDIDGVAGEKTVDVLNQIASANGIFALDFKQVYPLLEQLIVEKQKLAN